MALCLLSLSLLSLQATSQLCEREPGLEAWVLISQTGLNTTNDAVQHLSVQANLTQSSIPVSSGTQTEYFLKRVQGDSTTGPGWASWLTPISYSNPSVLYSWPSSGMSIPAGQTNYFGFEYDLETGSQDWQNGSEEAHRNRYWKTQGKDVEYIQ